MEISVITLERHRSCGIIKSHDTERTVNRKGRCPLCPVLHRQLVTGNNIFTQWNKLNGSTGTKKSVHIDLMLEGDLEGIGVNGSDTDIVNGAFRSFGGLGILNVKKEGCRRCVIIRREKSLPGIEKIIRRNGRSVAPFCLLQIEGELIFSAKFIAGIGIMIQQRIAELSVRVDTGHSFENE